MATATATSTSAVISTLTANLILFGVFVGCFLVLRIKFKRTYSPKYSYDLVPEEKKPDALPRDPLRWIYILLMKPDSFIIQQAGLDGYFFLRYLFVFGLIFMFGIAMFAILLPVNATNGGSKAKTGFDQLAISNVLHKNRYFAHVFMGWIFYGAVIYMIHRELFFYNSVRCAALSSPKYAKKLSSRTILIQCVPDTMLDERQFMKIFNGVKRVYVARNARKLDYKVRLRENVVSRLEKAENKLLKSAVKAKIKAEKKGTPFDPNADIYSYVPAEKRPRHRSGGLFSEKIDTINYCKEEIPKLDKEVKLLQKKYRTYHPKNSIFVEFEDQYTAQLALQSVTHHNPLRMGPVFTGIEPADVYWNNLRLFWWEKFLRKMFACSGIVLLIVFWAVPVAFVGVISNITYITKILPWLDWINNMPDKLLGIITGLLPTAMLSLLNTFLPIFIRYMAKVAGSPTAQLIEFYTQDAYFGYLMVNAFLIVALSSSATSVVEKIIDDPTSAMDILAQNLPLSSNFFISYIALQGLTVSSGALLQVVGLFLYYILGALLDATVRKKWNRFSGLGTMAWGTTFPVYTNLACIVLAYSIIAPMILAFACIAFFLLYIAYCYNLTYVFIESADSRGMHYPKALMQTFVGIYIGQVCLLGIFVVGKGWGPIVLQAISLGFTIMTHIYLNDAFHHLLRVVPIDCMKPLDGVSHTPSFQGKSDYQEKMLERKKGSKSDRLEKEIALDKKAQEEVKNDILNTDMELNENETKQTLVPLLADRDFKTTQSSNGFVRFFRPDVFLNYRHVKSLLPATFNVEPEEGDDRHAYDSPVIAAPLPSVWIPRDPMGLSTREVEEHSKYINISDENSGFNEKGKIIFLGKAPN
ncbi:uncharacterized protein AC631_00423 [Debaryomyces fabryi]|uniref:DUF221-domain-containing protein n=1 Tax=Debaryomyces fabryi TaxID=58627 RepID=A0A0V1Q5R8_9ASCO|nr:uncharacterized protein AC631_00423 [Debaryomyces fabryi]KSA03788.1 hypothetical protein AC631_00423 [Debaryomyces fabryi]CUM45306.1 unnamed protein product [Debaryomyces fabryi]